MLARLREGEELDIIVKLRSLAESPISSTSGTSIVLKLVLTEASDLLLQCIDNGGTVGPLRPVKESAAAVEGPRTVRGAILGDERVDPAGEEYREGTRGRCG